MAMRTVSKTVNPGSSPGSPASDDACNRAGPVSIARYRSAMALDGHRTAERRSVALHAAVVARLDDDAVARAAARVDGWLRDGGPVPPAAARAWRALLDGPRDALAAALVRDDKAMRDLRQNTPFAGTVAPAERWRIIREVR